LWGQDIPPSPAPIAAEEQASSSLAPPQASTNNGTSPAQKQSDGTSKDRLFFTLPNFLTLENSASAPPLTAGQKFKVTARGTFDPVELVWFGLQAGIAQAGGSDPSYGQGVEGYAKRYAQRFGDGSIQNFFTRAIFPSALHQDPRYFQMGEGGFLHRAAYAVSRIFVTRSDSGSTQFNFSEIFGGAAAAGISTFTYHPRESRNLANATHVWGTQIGFDALSYALKEFWPDLRRKMHHPKPAQASPAPTGASALVPGPGK
jgi:hypothetical protein